MGFKKAEMGIGTLIIFIAMILVSAIAAGVLIRTSQSLQSKALDTGQRSKNQVSTNLQMLLLSIEDGSVGNSVDRFYLKMKLAPASDPISFNKMLLEFSLSDVDVDMVYNSSKTCAEVNESNSTYYYVDYLIKGSHYNPGHLQDGDIVQLCFKSPRPVVEDERFEFLLASTRGTPLLYDGAVPNIITEYRMNIYP